MVKILAKSAACHEGAKIRVSRCDNPRINADHAIAADPPNRTILQRFQQLRLHCQRKARHLVKKKGAAFGCLQQSEPRLARISERTSLVPKQLRFRQIVRQRSTIYFDQRPFARGPF